MDVKETYYGNNEGRSNRTTIVKTTAKNGLGFGACLAMVISYTAWQSIPWAIVHGLLSWVYVVYYMLMY